MSFHKKETEKNELKARHGIKGKRKIGLGSTPVRRKMMMMKIGGYSLRSGCLKWTFVGVTGLSCCLPVWKGEQGMRRGMKASSCWSKSSAGAGGGAKTAVDHRRTSSPEAPTSEMLNSNQIEKNMQTARLNFEFLRGNLTRL